MKSKLILLLFLFFINSVVAQNIQFENLVFEGAGIRGIAYSGVISELEQKGIIKDIVKVGGTSAGAITAMMVSLGLTSEEMAQIISETKFQKFNDGKYLFIGGFSRLRSKHGWYKGDAFTKWLEAIIKSKTKDPDITFAQLDEKGYKKLYITATCLNQQKLLVFSSETYPNMKVKDAVRISMSIPLYFEAVFIDSIGKVYDKKNDNHALDVVVDGGIIGNYPIFIFDSTAYDSSNKIIRYPNKKTLGFRIDSELQIKNDSSTKVLVPIDINTTSEYLEALYTLVLEKLNRIPLTEADWERTISISSVGIGPKIQKLSSDNKAKLINSGKVNTAKYFKAKGLD